MQLYPERVKTLREEQGMSKRDLAVAAGISTTTAGHAERGCRSAARRRGRLRRPSESTSPSA